MSFKTFIRTIFRGRAYAEILEISDSRGKGFDPGSLTLTRQ